MLLFISLFFLFQISSVYGSCRTLEFRTISVGQVLTNHTIRRIQPISDVRICRSKCFLESLCFGINYCEKDGSPVCELANSDHIRSEGDMKKQSGCTYYGSESMCSSNPCVSNATCQGDFLRDPQPYKCICPAGYTGQMCELEIDECASGTHGCHINATCTNTIGGHTCTCINGFEGDGKLCNDIDECTSDSHGCHVNATCTNTIGGNTCSCRNGLLGNGSFCLYPRNCDELKEVITSNASTGFYLIQENGQLVYKFCQIGDQPGCGEGSWTMVMKMDGTKTTFQYQSEFWKNKISYNEEAVHSGLETIETKQPAFWNKPMKKLCLGMTYAGITSWISTSLQATSLFSAIANKANIKIGRDKWTSLLRPVQMENYCNKEGFDEPCEGQKSIISFWSNNKDHCNDCDAFIVFGGTDPVCGDRNFNDNEKRKASFCFILIQ